MSWKVTPRERRLIEAVLASLEAATESRASSECTGSYQVKLSFRRGELVEVFIDEDTKLKPTDLPERDR